ncbi:hypothetical protein M758_11G022600 [Ceratodon purpureus]|nr:hypothetical protein M758_11G022600 [Ceratodon purpureus]
MPWQSNIEIRGSCWLSCSGDPSRTMFSISGSIGKSRCGLLHPLPAELLVAGVGVPSSQCSVTNDDLDLLSSWLSNSFGDGESANSSASEGVRSVDRSSNCSVPGSSSFGYCLDCSFSVESESSCFKLRASADSWSDWFSCCSGVFSSMSDSPEFGSSCRKVQVEINTYVFW